MIFAGTILLEVQHEGRSQYSPEEAPAIVTACMELLDGGTATLREGGTWKLATADIMVVVPFNMAVREIQAAVPEGVRSAPSSSARARRRRWSPTR